MFRGKDARQLRSKYVMEKKEKGPNFQKFTHPLANPGYATVIVVGENVAFCVQEYHSIELCAKLLFQTELVRTRRDQDFGFSVEAKVADGCLDDDELCVIVSDVTKGGPVALKKGCFLCKSLAMY